MTKLTMMQRALQVFTHHVATAMLAFGGAVLQGCGGAADATTAPRLGDDYIVFWMDAAEPADYDKAAKFKYEFRATPFDVVIATDDPRASYARLQLIDYIGTEAFILEIVR